jgi:hypothetical protein
MAIAPPLLPFSAFGGGGARAFRHKEIFYRPERVRTQSAFFPPHRLKIAALEKTGEETLGQIFSFFAADALAPDETVNGWPIGATKSLQGRIHTGR